MSRKSYMFSGIILSTVCGILYLGFYSLTPLPEKKDHRSTRFTSGDLAVSNLNSQITALEKLARSTEDNSDIKALLFEAIKTRVKFLGTYRTDLPRLKQLAENNAIDAAAAARKVSYLSTVHEFKQAQIQLQQAANSWPDSLKLKNLSAEIEFAMGSDTEIKGNITESLLFKAEELARKGKFEKADVIFQKAFDSLHDTLPFPAAYLLFRRALMWAESAGESKKALPYYERAIELLPAYVTARVHLAEIYFEREEFAKALKLLTPALKASDPEPKGLAGEILVKMGKTEEGMLLIKQAESMYTKLLAEFPKAFYDHAAEFFGGVGNDRKRSLEYALANLENRFSQRALSVALRSALSSGDDQTLARLCGLSNTLPITSVPLREQINEVRCST